VKHVLVRAMSGVEDVDDRAVTPFTTDDHVSVRRD
jgi:hypothetical protein